MNRQWIELDGWFYRARPYILEVATMFEEIDERQKLAGQSSWGTGILGVVNVQPILQKKEGRLRRA